MKVSTNTIWISNLLFHPTFTVLGFLTLFFRKLKSCPGQKGGLGGLPPSPLKILQIIMENSPNLRKINHSDLEEKQTFTMRPIFLTRALMRSMFFLVALAVNLYFRVIERVVYRRLKILLSILIWTDNFRLNVFARTVPIVRRTTAQHDFITIKYKVWNDIDSLAWLLFL